LGLITYRLPNEAEGSQVCEAARWVQTLDFLEGFPGTWLNRFISVQKSQSASAVSFSKTSSKAISIIFNDTNHLFKYILMFIYIVL